MPSSPPIAISSSSAETATHETGEDELIASGGDEGKVVLYSRATHDDEQGKPRSGSGYSVGHEDDVLLGR